MKHDPGATAGRDGCRVPLPWTATGPSFGFGPGAPHLPQPEWFRAYAVDVEAADTDSTLSFYRRALDLRRELQTDEALEWLEYVDPVLAFRRPGGWVSITNFGSSSVPLPTGRVLVSSSRSGTQSLPPDTTVWLQIDAIDAGA